MATADPTSMLSCPSCGAASEEVMPTDACLYFWTCPDCGVRHRPKDGDCCVFCSYGTRPCPPVQKDRARTCSDPAVLNALQVIPGVGPAVSRDLWALGMRSVEDLRGQDPEDLYARLCILQQTEVDRCMLYTLRCAVYYASHEEHDPELLKWWRWKG